MRRTDDRPIAREKRADRGARAGVLCAAARPWPSEPTRHDDTDDTQARVAVTTEGAPGRPRRAASPRAPAAGSRTPRSLPPACTDSTADPDAPLRLRRAALRYESQSAKFSLYARTGLFRVPTVPYYKRRLRLEFPSSIP